jgi:acyl-CoA thioesterase-2
VQAFTTTAPDDPCDLLALQDGDGGASSGVCMDGSFGRVFGGQVLAQSIMAASRALDGIGSINSLHAYFVSPGRAYSPITYNPLVLKRGRSIGLARVTATQGGRTVLEMSVSSHIHEPSVEFQPTAPPLPGAEELTSSTDVHWSANPNVRAPFDIRYASETDGVGDGIAAWIRTRRAVSSPDPATHAALLAYAVDFLITRASHARLAQYQPLAGASLDHAMWFHRPFRADEWLLVICRGQTFAGSRTLAGCEVYRQDGTLVASAGQEALLRPASSTDTSMPGANPAPLP